MHSSCRTVWCLAAVATLSVAAGVATLASDILTEGVDNARTGWVRDEKVFTTANVARIEAAVEGEAREHAARDAQPVRAAHRRAGHHRRRARASSAVVAGVSDDLFGIDVATGKQIWHRHFDSTLANPRRHERHALPGRPDRRADDGAGVAGQVHRLRGVVGWPAAAGQPGRRPGRRAAREVHPRRRQAVRAQPAQRRDLHRDRAGLRRPDQRVLLVRPRVTPRQRVHPRGRRPVGPPRRVDRSRRHASTSAPATRSSIRRPSVSATASSA